MGKQTKKEKGANRKKSCFVITPIGGDTDPIRRHIDGIIDAAIIPSLEPRFEVKVAHRMFSPDSITKQIIQQLHESDLVVANLTGLNPNVMYELAIRHCEGSQVIVIAEEGTELPFDINTVRTIFYMNDAKGVLELKDALARYVQKLQFDQELRGPVYDALRVISQDNKVIQNVRSSKDAEVLQHILNKLERIEERMGRNLQMPSEKADCENYSRKSYGYRDTVSSINNIGTTGSAAIQRVLRPTLHGSVLDNINSTKNPLTTKK